MNEHCIVCEKLLRSDEIALSRKMINRGTTKFFCLQCLSHKFDVPVEILLRKIDEFREMGCTLFTDTE